MLQPVALCILIGTVYHQFATSRWLDDYTGFNVSRRAGVAAGRHVQ
jgi:hypothetical protein